MAVLSTYWFDSTFSGTRRSKTTRTLLLFSFKERHAFNASIPMNVNTLCLWMNCFINKKFLSGFDTWGYSRLKQFPHPAHALTGGVKLGGRALSCVSRLGLNKLVTADELSTHKNNAPVLEPRVYPQIDRSRTQSPTENTSRTMLSMQWM